MTIYEHRRTMVAPGRFEDYRALMLDQVWGGLEDAGYRPLCFLSIFIGGTPEETHTFVGYPSWDELQRGQELVSGVGDLSRGDLRSARRELVVSEEMRPRIAFSGRPLPETPTEDRRAAYGIRRWLIDPEHWDHFTALSHDGVWPAMDAMGHRVLGQFRDAALTDPLEVLNLPGYHSAGHWYETRSPQNPDSGVPDKLRRLFEERLAERDALVRETWVQLANAHWPDDV